MVVTDPQIESLLPKLIPIQNHQRFQESISESKVLASACYVLPLGDDKTTISLNQGLVFELLHDLATGFLSSHRKWLNPPKGGQYTLYDKFISGPARSMVEAMFTKDKNPLAASCFNDAQQITLYVSLKNSFAGQALCVRAILNNNGDGRPSNRGALLMRTVVPS